jgi:hypothetical protein
MTKRLLSIEKRAVLSGWILGALLVLALGAAYQPVWHAGFIWDDDQHLRFLATSPIAHLRDGTNAVKLAESANRLTDGRDAVVVTTLAAAYAEVGRFAEAIQTAERALQLANQFGNTALVEGIRGHIASYCSGQPIRDVR